MGRQISDEEYHKLSDAIHASLNQQCVCEFVDIGVGMQKVAEDPMCPRCTMDGTVESLIEAVRSAGSCTTTAKKTTNYRSELSRKR